VQLSTTATRYSVTLAIPSIAGKTLGTNNDHYTRLTFWLSSGATQNAAAGGIGVQSATFVFWGVQLEIGPTATPLEKLDPRNDLANCQRFYQTGGIQYYGYGAAGETVVMSTPPPVTMRGAPTIVTTVGLSNNATGASVGWAAAPYNFFNVSGVVTALGAFNLLVSFTASADL
jgi:hypothetical protein